jgi:hypothetical protein
MMPSALLLLSLCGLAISSSAKAIVPGCGNPPPSESEIARAQAMHVKEKMMSADIQRRDLVTVPTWFHVVYVNETEQGGYIPVMNYRRSTKQWRMHANALRNRETNSTPKLVCSAMLGHHMGSPLTWST